VFQNCLNFDLLHLHSEMYQPVQFLMVLKKILRRDNGRVYLAGYSGDLLIDYGEISSSGGKQGRAIEPHNWLLTLINATFF
jgi:hypothetical protein